MNDQYHALNRSVERLRAIVDALEPDELTTPAYPTEWTIADTLSHIGSGAVIMRNAIATVATGGTVDPSFNQSVWDEWNAKTPDAQAAGVLVADEALLETVQSLTPEQQETATFALGPMTLDLAGFLRMRLAEHALHTWDVEVVLDADAVVSDEAAGLLAPNLPMIAGFASKTDGSGRTVSIRTSGPTREFVLTLGPDAVVLAPTESLHGDIFDIPCESLVRLVYGRLDPDHTPAGIDATTIESLRPIFPGF